MQTTQAKAVPEIPFRAVKSKDEVVRLIREVVHEVRENCVEDRRADTRWRFAFLLRLPPVILKATGIGGHARWSRRTCPPPECRSCILRRFGIGC